MTVPVEPASRPWWKRAWAWGFIATIVLAIVPPLFDSEIKWQVSMVVVLIGWVLTSAIEQYIELDAAQQRLGGRLEQVCETSKEVQRRFGVLVDSMVLLTPVAKASEQCQAFVAQLATDWSTIEARNHHFFREILDAFHREFAQHLSDLADDEAMIDADKPYSFHALPLDRICELRMVHVGDLQYWSSPAGRKYLARQAANIKAGKLNVQRIFVLDDFMADSARSVITAHAQAGINVKIALRENVPHQARQHFVDQGLVTDANGEKMVVRPVPNSRGEQSAGQESLSYRQDQVASTEYSFITLWEDYSDEAEDVYPELAGQDANLSTINTFARPTSPPIT
jgi:hypothetical protein